MAAWLEALEDGPRCRKWKLRWARGRGSGRKSASERFDGSKREANAALRDFEERCENAPTEDCPSFASFCRAWNDARLSTGSISQSTHENYANVLSGLSMHIGKSLSEVRARDVEAALAALKLGDSPSGRPWGGTSLRTAYKVCRKMMEDAVARGYAASNPCESVKPPRGDTRRRRALSIGESARLLESLDLSDAHQFAVGVMLKTGLRAGECVAARWDDVLPSGLLVRREATKTDAGERIVPLDASAWGMLAERFAYIHEAAATVGAEPSFSDPLCCTDDGRAMTYNAMKHWWANHAGDFGMEGWTLHELRHTFATNLAQADVHPSTMASLLGHSSSEVTMEIYTHVHQEDMQRAIEALASRRGA